jgi:hypothetical protein
VLFGSYRRGDANDPDAYVAAIAAVLSSYPAEIIREATDPRTGIAATQKFAAFMPNAGELKLFLDDLAAFRERLAKARDLPPVVPFAARLAPPERPAGRQATTFIGSTLARYAEAVEWARGADERFWRMGQGESGQAGIWVCWDEFAGGGGAQQREAAE